MTLAFVQEFQILCDAYNISLSDQFINFLYSVIAALRRDPAYILGDEIHTVLELIIKANKHPARGGPHFSPI